MDVCSERLFIEVCGICGFKGHREEICDLLALKASMLVKDRVPPVKAHLTLPPCLDLVEKLRKKESQTEVDGDGPHSNEWIHARESIPRGTWFGPLDAAKTRRLLGNPRIKLASMENRGGLPLWYNTCDPTVCNWMMLVPICKRNQFTSNENEASPSDPNLLVVEHQGKVYFVVSREIRPGERLKAIYSPAYRTAIGKLLAVEKRRFRNNNKAMSTSSEKRTKDTTTVEDEPEEVVRYICADCSICFHTEADIQEHIQEVHRNGDDVVSETADECIIQSEHEPHTTRDGQCRLQEVEPSTLRFDPESSASQPTLPLNEVDNAGSPSSIRDMSTDASNQTLEEVMQHDKGIVPTDAALGSYLESNTVGGTHTAISVAARTSTNPLMRAGAACHICLKWLSSVTTLRSHIRACQLPGDGEVPDSGECRYCGLVLDSLPEYRRHVLSHLLEHECPLCRARFRLKSVLLSHACPCLRNGLEVIVEHRCDICEIDLGNLISTELHLRLGCQGQRRPLKCDRCEQSFFLQASLNRHLCFLHGEERLPEIDPEATGPGFVCEICGALLSSSSALNKHRVIHAKPTFECVECNKSFHRRDGLEAHMITHRRHQIQENQQERNEANEGPSPLATESSANPIRHRHTCNICGKRLSTRGSLRVHLRGHSSNSRYHCPHCDRGYNQKSNLDKHLISVHQTVKFWCAECQRSFTSKESLDLHSLDHQGVPREHRCSLCPAAFHRGYQLRRHQRHLHHGRVFECPLCASNMKLASSLLRHLRSIHPDRPDVAARYAQQMADLCKSASVGADGDIATGDFQQRQMDNRNDYSVETEAAIQDISAPHNLDDASSLQLLSITEEDSPAYPQ